MTCDSCGHKSIKAGEQAGAPAVDAHRAGHTGHGQRCKDCGGFLRVDGGCAQCERRRPKIYPVGQPARVHQDGKGIYLRHGDTKIRPMIPPDESQWEGANYRRLMSEDLGYRAIPATPAESRVESGMQVRKRPIGNRVVDVTLPDGSREGWFIQPQETKKTVYQPSPSPSPDNMVTAMSGDEFVEMLLQTAAARQTAAVNRDREITGEEIVAVLRKGQGLLPGETEIIGGVRGLELRNAKLKGINLGVAGPASARIRMPDADLRGSDLRDAKLEGVDLARAQLQKANLQGADLSEAQLQKANLQGASLNDANLRYANLSAANLRGANLEGCNLYMAKLQGADLRGADLSGADLKRAKLQGTNLTGAKMEGCRLIRCTYDNDTQWPDGFTPPPAAIKK